METLILIKIYPTPRENISAEAPFSPLVTHAIIYHFNPRHLPIKLKFITSSILPPICTFTEQSIWWPCMYLNKQHYHDFIVLHFIVSLFAETYSQVHLRSLSLDTVFLVKHEVVFSSSFTTPGKHRMTTVPPLPENLFDWITLHNEKRLRSCRRRYLTRSGCLRTIAC